MMKKAESGVFLGWFIVLCGGLLIVALARPATALTKQSLVTVATVTEGNSFYKVYVDDSGADIGRYTATTGPSHPAGNGLNVLFGDGSPGTTFNTIRSYTSNTDYVQGTGVTSSNPVVDLSPFGSVSAIGTTGVRTTYVLPGGATTPDALTIVQDVNVNGTTFANSTVEVTTSVTNNSTAGPVQIGIRYEWDFQIANDDGPTFQAISPNGAVLTNETQFLPPAFESYRMEDNNPPNAPTFDVFGTVTGPASVTPTPTAPDLLQYVSWPKAVGTAFDYTVNPALDIASPEGDDSAVLYFFGHNSGAAISIPAGETRTVSASLFLKQAAPQAVGAAAPAVHGGTLLVLAMLLGGAGVWVLAKRRGIA
jgi:hypothetical protein